jgi:hypothetical protein
VYSGDTNFSTMTSSPLAQSIQDFSVSMPGSGSSSVTVSAGGTATYSLVVTPVSGSSLLGAVNLSVAGLPSGFTGTFSPSSVPASSGTTNVTLTVSVPAHAEVLPLQRPFGAGALPVALGLILLPFAGRLRRSARRLRNPNWSRAVCLMVLGLAGAASLAGLAGCGGGSSNSTPTSQTYILTITAASGADSHSTTVSLTVD